MMNSSSILLAPVRPAAGPGAGVSPAPSSPLELSKSLREARRSLGDGGGHASPLMNNSNSPGLFSRAQPYPGSAPRGGASPLSLGSGDARASDRSGSPASFAQPVSSLQRTLQVSPSELDAAAHSLRLFVSNYISSTFLPAVAANISALCKCNPALTPLFLSGVDPGARLALPTALQNAGAALSLDALLAQQRHAFDTRYVVPRRAPPPDELLLLLPSRGGHHPRAFREGLDVEVDLFEEYESLRVFACPEPYASAAHVRRLIAEGDGAFEDAGGDGDGAAGGAGVPDARVFALTRLAAFSRDPSLLDFLGGSSGPEQQQAQQLPSDSEILLNFVFRLLDAAVSRACRGAWTFTDRPFYKACVALSAPQPRDAFAMSGAHALLAGSSAPSGSSSSPGRVPALLGEVTHPTVSVAAILAATKPIEGAPPPASMQLLLCGGGVSRGRKAAATAGVVVGGGDFFGTMLGGGGGGALHAGAEGAGSSPSHQQLQQQPQLMLRRQGVTFEPRQSGARHLTHALALLLLSLQSDDNGCVGGVSIKSTLSEMLSNKADLRGLGAEASGRGGGNKWRALGLLG